MRSLALVLVLLAGCSAPTAGGALQVLVNLEPGLISRCVKVVASDAATTRETEPIALDGKRSPLRVAVYGEGFTSPVSVQAVGFTDTGCMVRSGEVSEVAEANFGSGVGVVTVTLAPSTTALTDGGPDSGVDAGLDAGVDAGIDQDQDGVPLPADCDDTNPNIRPGVAEVCTNGVDDDCDGPVDCEDGTCAGERCVGGGTCLGTSCTASTEVSCTDNRDNDGDGLVDCADSECTPGTTCNDGDFCTTGEVCVGDGGCEKSADVLCNMPPMLAACHVSAGVCRSDGGAVCEYAVLVDAGCDDGLACTDVSSCSALGTCSSGPVRTCAPPTNTCLRSIGCQEPSGLCGTAPVDAGTGACSDGDNCTLGDTCDGDGGCSGTAQACPAPSQCHVFANACDDDGGCRFDARTGLACDAGIAAGAATCAGDFSCAVTPVTLFPYVPSNFTEAELPALDGGNDLLIGCSAEINTSNTPSTDAGCFALPAFTLITPAGGTSTVLFAMNDFTLQAGHTLTITGSRPAIFAVVGDAKVDGAIRVRAGANQSAACGAGVAGGTAGGGGGGGFGTDGGTGGQCSGTGGRGGGFNGNPTLEPIRGGCNGGAGSTGALGGAGGGGLQLSASGTVGVTGVVTSPGRGGEGATSAELNGGGGGSGGGLLLEGDSVVLTATAAVTANGGGGGGGEDGSGGQAGLDGRDALATTADGGLPGGSAGGRGGYGAAGATGAQNGSNSGNSSDGAGGAGGGVGRIRFNARGACTVTSGAVVSPQATSNGRPGCP